MFFFSFCSKITKKNKRKKSHVFLDFTNNSMMSNVFPPANLFQSGTHMCAPYKLRQKKILQHQFPFFCVNILFFLKQSHKKRLNLIFFYLSIPFYRFHSFVKKNISIDIHLFSFECPCTHVFINYNLIFLTPPCQQYLLHYKLPNLYKFWCSQEANTKIMF